MFLPTLKSITQAPIPIYQAPLNDNIDSVSCLSIMAAAGDPTPPPLPILQRPGVSCIQSIDSGRLSDPGMPPFILDPGFDQSGGGALFLTPPPGPSPGSRSLDWGEGGF